MNLAFIKKKKNRVLRQANAGVISRAVCPWFGNVIALILHRISPAGLYCLRGVVSPITICLINQWILFMLSFLLKALIVGTL